VHLLHIFFVSHNKWTRPILYVVIYFFCNVFPTIHTLVYVITFVHCHYLYLDVCVCVTSTEFIKIACILLYKNFLQKVTNYEVFSLFHFLFNKIYIQNMYCLFSSPCQRLYELLPSLGVRRLSSVNF
jgi:hypothetical protein